MFCPVGFADLDHPYLQFTFAGEKTMVNNESVKGKVVLINFWFEGCHPCMAEMAAFNDLFNRMKNSKDFIFISVTRDDKETIKRVKEKFSLDFDVFSASGKECQRLTFGCGYPTSIILDKKGVLKYHSSGGSIVQEEANQFIMTTLLPEIESLL